MKKKSLSLSENDMQVTYIYFSYRTTTCNLKVWSKLSSYFSPYFEKEIERTIPFREISSTIFFNIGIQRTNKEWENSLLLEHMWYDMTIRWHATRKYRQVAHPDEIPGKLWPRSDPIDLANTTREKDCPGCLTNLHARNRWKLKFCTAQWMRIVLWSQEKLIIDS